MEININGDDLIQYVPIVFIGIIVFGIVMYLFNLFMKNKDNSEPLKSVKAKILEKPIQQGNTEWYTIECEDGRRLKLRSFQSNDLIITVGDVGVISYRGKTIQSFQREG